MDPAVNERRLRSVFGKFSVTIDVMLFLSMKLASFCNFFLIEVKEMSQSLSKLYFTLSFKMPSISTITKKPSKR
jgi:hypothetical protein